METQNQERRPNEGESETKRDREAQPKIDESSTADSGVRPTESTVAGNLGSANDANRKRGAPNRDSVD